MDTMPDEQQDRLTLLHLPIIGPLNRITDYLSAQEIGNLSSTCGAMYKAVRFRTMRRMEHFAADRPGMLYWSAVNGHATNVVDLLKSGLGDVNTALATPAAADFAVVRGQTDPAPLVLFRDWFRNHHPCTGYDLFDNAFQMVPWTEAARAVLDPAHYSLEQQFGLSPLEMSECHCQLSYPLHLAAISDSLRLAKLFVGQGAQVDVPGRWLLDLINKATTTSERRIVQTLNTLTNPSQAYLFYPLYISLVASSSQVAEYLLTLEGSSRRCWISDATLSPIHAAAAAKTDEMLRLVMRLMPDQCNLEEENFAGNPPVWVAYLNNNWTGINWLQSYGVSIEYDLGQGFTPLVHAAMLGGLEGFRELLQAGADQGVVFQTLSDEKQAVLFDMDGYMTDSRRKLFFEEAQGLRPVELLCFICVLGHYEWPNAHGDVEVSQLLRRVARDGTLKVSSDRTSAGVSWHSVAMSVFGAHKGIQLDFTGSKYDKRMQKGHSRSKILQVIFELGADALANDDLTGKELMSLALAEWDFESCLVIGKHCLSAVQVFANRWTLDEYLQTFFHEDEKPESGARHELVFEKEGWASAGTLCRDGLKTLVELGVVDAQRDLFEHPLFRKFLVASFKPSWPGYGGRHHAHHGILEYVLSLGLPGGLLRASDFLDGLPLLHHAALAEDFDSVRLLVSAGADPNHSDRTGCTLAAYLVSCCDLVDESWEFERLEEMQRAVGELLWFLSKHGLVFHVATPPDRDPSQPYSLLKKKCDRPQSQGWIVTDGPDVAATDWAMFNPLVAAFRLTTADMEYRQLETRDDFIAALLGLFPADGSVALLQDNEVRGLFHVRAYCDDPATCPVCYMEDDDYNFLDGDLDVRDAPVVKYRPGPVQVPRSLHAVYQREACHNPESIALSSLLRHGADPDAEHPDDGLCTLVWLMERLAEYSHIGQVEGSDDDEVLGLDRIATLFSSALHWGADYHKRALSPHASSPLQQRPSFMDHVLGLLGKGSPELTDIWGKQRGKVVNGLKMQQVLRRQSGQILLDAGGPPARPHRIEPLMQLEDCPWF